MRLYPSKGNFNRSVFNEILPSEIENTIEFHLFRLEVQFDSF
jgi:hypothetical protein